MPNAVQRSFIIFACLLLMFAAIGSLKLQSQQTASSTEDYVKAHYTKYEYRIPMRDGKKLFTAVYVPKDSAFPNEAGPHPFLMDRPPIASGRMAKICIRRILARPMNLKRRLISLSIRT